MGNIFGVFVFSFIMGMCFAIAMNDSVQYKHICNDMRLYEPQFTESVTYKKYCEEITE